MDLITTSILFVIMIVILVVMNKYLRRGRSKRGGGEERPEGNVWAWATVLSAKSTPSDAGGKMNVEMQLQVHLPGSQPYPATTTWSVEQESLGYVETGKDISVRVDPQNPQVIRPQGSWARFVK